MASNGGPRIESRTGRRSQKRPNSLSCCFSMTCCRRRWFCGRRSSQVSFSCTRCNSSVVIFSQGDSLRRPADSERLRRPSGVPLRTRCSARFTLVFSYKYCRQLRTHSVMLSSLPRSVVTRPPPFRVPSPAGGETRREPLPPLPSRVSEVLLVDSLSEWLPSAAPVMPRSLSNFSVSSLTVGRSNINVAGKVFPRARPSLFWMTPMSKESSPEAKNPWSKFSMSIS
mmetsp:Transcript_7406/g.16781  ORF Transcript_7406/g.16781 Transcript_7406/m.16781 type:complete len:226 (+) Transcript_7406:208-885(+)